MALKILKLAHEFISRQKLGTILEARHSRGISGIETEPRPVTVDGPFLTISVRWVDHHVLGTLRLVPGAAALLVDIATVVDRHAAGRNGINH
jgi:hypothetical protein